MPHYGVNGIYYFGTGTQTGLTYPDNTTKISQLVSRIWSIKFSKDTAELLLPRCSPIPSLNYRRGLW